MIAKNSTLKDEFEEYSIECEAALRTTMAKIINVREIIKRSAKRNPFDSIDDRIKTFKSVKEKAERKGYDLEIETIKQNILDVAGIRIITPFRDDIYDVVEIFHHIPGFNIICEKDYVKKPKENGYASYHIAMLVEIYSPVTGGSKLIPVEVQIRDKAMDLWATIEHIIGYKNHNASPEIGENFKNIAGVLSRFDDMAIALRDSNTKKK